MFDFFLFFGFRVVLGGVGEDSCGFREWHLEAEMIQDFKVFEHLFRSVRWLSEGLLGLHVGFKIFNTYSDG